jgi:hypothetical protein
VYHLIRVSTLKINNQYAHKISRWRFNSCYTEEDQICDEIS